MHGLKPIFKEMILSRHGNYVFQKNIENGNKTAKVLLK